MAIMGIAVAVIIVFVLVIVLGQKLGGVFKSGSSTVSGEELEANITMINVVGKNFDEAKTTLRGMGLEVQATYETSATVAKDNVISQNVAEGEKIAEGSVVELAVSSGADGVVVPSVIGKTEAEARVALENEGFQMQKEESPSDSVPKGNVVSQNPSDGQSAEKGSVVSVIISTGKSSKAVAVPDIRLQTEADAKALLTAAGLTWTTIDQAYSDIVPMGCVISQSYSPGVSVDEGTSVNFTISMGSQVVTYKCNFNVNAPSAYQGGSAEVVLTQAGTNAVLFKTNVSAFPVGINLTGITGEGSGVITVTYTVSTPVEQQNDDGSVSTGMKQEVKSDYQQVAFQQE